MDGEIAMPESGPIRAPLPPRRRSITQWIRHQGQEIKASIGFYDDGRPAELFLTGAKDGSHLARILDDTSVVISVALQYGVPAAALAKSIGRLPAHEIEPDGSNAATIIGAALDIIEMLAHDKTGSA